MPWEGRQSLDGQLAASAPLANMPTSPHDVHDSILGNWRDLGAERVLLTETQSKWETATMLSAPVLPDSLCATLLPLAN